MSYDGWCGDPECCDLPEVPLLERTPEQLVELIEQLEAENAAEAQGGAAAREALRNEQQTLANLRLGHRIGECLGSGRVHVLAPVSVEMIRGTSDDVMNHGGGVFRRYERPERIIMTLQLDIDSADTINRLNVLLEELSQ